MLVEICLGLVVVVAAIAIPGKVWSLLRDNCTDQRGRLRARYVWRETREVGNIFAGFLLASVVLTSLIVGVMILIDSRDIPLNLSPLITQQAGQSSETITDSTVSLRGSLPIAIVIGFAIALIAVRLFSRGYKLAMDRLVMEASARNRQKIAEYYLRKTAQSDGGWHRTDDDPECG
jgi:ABC-type Fe3+ transport system permease subunit